MLKLPPKLARHWLALATLTATLGLGEQGTALARPRGDEVLEPDAGVIGFAYPAQRGVSLAQATAIATSRYRGRVVRAETVSNGDRMIHEIRILGEDGRVRTVRIDAQSGAIL